MQITRHLVPALAMLAISASSFAAATIYSSESGFLSQLTASYTESFDGLPNGPAGPQSFGSGPFAFTAFAPQDLFLEGGFLSTSQIDDALTVSFGAGVRAFGANFFASDFNGAPQVAEVTLTLADGTAVSLPPDSWANSYRGFTSDMDIASFTISGPGQSLYASLDNLTVGTTQRGQVPEPASLALVGLALAGLFATRRRAA